MDTSDQARIDAAIGRLTPNEQKLREEALEEGDKDEICPKENCGRVLLAHHHFLVCEPRSECPMISKTLVHPDGTPKSFLDMLAE